MLARLFNTLFIFLLISVIFASQAHADFFELPGVVPPSGCRVGGVFSTEQFTTTGFSNVRTANPNDEIVAGAWVVANNSVPDTSIVLPAHCSSVTELGSVDDDLGINVIGIRLTPTIASAAEADVDEIMLVWDVNANGLWDPLLDLVLQTKSGQELDTQDGAIFWNGPQNPMAVLTDTTGGTPDDRCVVGIDDSEPDFGLGPSTGTNSRLGDTDGCYIALLAIVNIGPNPTTGSQFGLSLEALAGDIPGATGSNSNTFSSGFSSSRNPQASNVRLHMVGGTPGSHTPLEHISNGSGAPESHVSALNFTGGQSGEGLLSRFRAQEILPGTREAIAMVAGICDGGVLVNINVPILPSIAGSTPMIAGGLTSTPCIGSEGTDGYGTGINGATLIFRGPLARYMGTVRMYVDLCGFRPIVITSAVGAQRIIEPGCTGGIVAASSHSTTDSAVLAQQLPQLRFNRGGGGDGQFFEAGELVDQVVPKFNEQTGEAIAQFGARQEQVLFTITRNPVAHGSDPACRTSPPCSIINPLAGSTPLIIIWTVDIDSNAPAGLVDVLLGLQTFDDTALNIASGGGNPCRLFFGGLPTAPTKFGAIGLPGACGSNFMNPGPELNSFTINSQEDLGTPNNLNAFDSDSSCYINDSEFFGSIDTWVDGQIGETMFFDIVDAWVGQENICVVMATGDVSALSLEDVELQSVLGTATFSVTGQGITSMGVEIFSLNGNVIFSHETAGTTLNWNQMTTAGAPVANGTYLYVVTALGSDGTSLTSEVQKLAVVR